MNARTRLAVLLVATPLVVFALVGGFLGQASAREESYQHLRIFEDVVSLITSNYVEDVNVDKVMDGAMRGLAEGLDADSAWLTPALAALVYVCRQPLEPPTGKLLGVAHIQRLLREPPSSLVAGALDESLESLRPEATIGQVAAHLAYRSSWSTGVAAGMVARLVTTGAVAATILFGMLPASKAPAVEPEYLTLYIDHSQSPTQVEIFSSMLDSEDSR